MHRSVSSFSAKKDNTEGDDTMAKPRMDLSAFVGKLLEEQDGDVLREGIRVLSQALMESEVAGLIGAERHERNKSQVDLNLVALIDIFTILIFFLLSSATGVGLHSGEKVYMTLRPAPASTSTSRCSAESYMVASVPAWAARSTRASASALREMCVMT